MMLVKELMSKKVKTVGENDNVRSVCRLLIKFKVSGFPVVSKSGKLVGFISERDIIAAVPRSNFLNLTAKQMMSKKVHMVPDDAPIMLASKIFTDAKIRLLPVIQKGKLVGILSRKEMVRHMMGHYY